MWIKSEFSQGNVEKFKRKAGSIIDTTYKMIALDLDETTLATSTTLAEDNRAALERAAAQGIEIVIASGRSLMSMAGVFPLFPWTNYAICSNGATVNRVPSGELIMQEILPESVVNTLLSITNGRKVTFEAYVNGQAYGQRDYIAAPENYMTDEMTAEYVKRTRLPVDNILKFIHENIQSLQSLSLIYGNQQEKDDLLPKLAELKESGKAYVTSSGIRMAEIESARCGKHMGLKYLSEMLNIPQEEIIAFGNADNDAEMLKWAGVGVAVSNASDYCKACADLITADYRDCGVARALETLLK